MTVFVKLFLLRRKKYIKNFGERELNEKEEVRFKAADTTTTLIFVLHSCFINLF